MDDVDQRSIQVSFFLEYFLYWKMWSHKTERVCRQERPFRGFLFVWRTSVPKCLWTCSDTDRIHLSNALHESDHCYLIFLNALLLHITLRSPMRVGYQFIFILKRVFCNNFSEYFLGFVFHFPLRDIFREVVDYMFSPLYSYVCLLWKK